MEQELAGQLRVQKKETLHFGIERRIIKLQKGDGSCAKRTKAADRFR